jgi:putative chitobiose transport system permease protein
MVVSRYCLKGLLYAILVVIALFMIGPLLWLFSTALKSSQENLFSYPPQLIPASPTLSHFWRVWRDNPFPRYLLNSTLVSGLTVILNLVICSLAAYPLARLQFPGKTILFWILIGTSMIPFQITMIPLYILVVQFDLKNEYLGLIFPYVVSGFGVFLLRQALLSVPQELEDAARMDGCSHLGIWWHVMLPSIRPALTALAIFILVGMWGDFLWPLLVVDDPQLFTLPLGVANLASAFSADWRLIAAGSVISILPILIVFLLTQRYIIATDVGSGIQG